jgi:hypothetical protein
VIVISGALVLVALVLLIIGVVGPELSFVYASIAVSLVSLVFLVIGILQRRGETAPAAEAAPAPAPAVAQETGPESVTAVIPAPAAAGSTSRRIAEQPPVAETADEELELGGTVLVVEGRPRYHVAGCRYLSGKQAEDVDVLDAREEGFTPCGVCKPDDELASRAAAGAAADEQEPVVEEQGEEPVVEEDVPGVQVPAARTATRAVKAPAKKAAASRPAAAKAPAKAAAAAKAPTKTAAKKAPSKAATAALASTPAASTAAKKAGSVVVIPDRGKFHKAECRYVRDVAEAEVLSKTAATRQGYAACGVCKP